MTTAVVFLTTLVSTELLRRRFGALLCGFAIGTKTAPLRPVGRLFEKGGPPVEEESIMKKSAQLRSQEFVSLVFISALGLSTGCLYQGDPGHIAGDPDLNPSLAGVRIELIRHSTGCGSDESQGLIVEVGPGLEYAAETVAALKANCSEGPNPGVEVHVEDSAIVFDFSNVVEPGRFSDGEFEGYILDLVRTEGAPFVFGAVVDREASTLDVVQSDLSYDLDRVEVNLANRAFDSSSFLKVDLILARVSAADDAASSGEM